MKDGNWYIVTNAALNNKILSKDSGLSEMVSKFRLRSSIMNNCSPNIWAYLAEMKDDFHKRNGGLT